MTALLPVAEVAAADEVRVVVPVVARVVVPVPAAEVVPAAVVPVVVPAGVVVLPVPAEVELEAWMRPSRSRWWIWDLPGGGRGALAHTAGVA